MEEKVINGSLAYRTGPLEDWVNYTTIELTERLLNMEEGLNQIQQKLTELSDVLQPQV